MLSATLFGLVAALPVREAMAGAWTLPRAQGQAILSVTSSRASEGFGAAGRDDLVPDLSKTEVDLLLEYGLSDRLTIVARPQLQFVSLGPPGHVERTGLGFSELGLRGLVWRDERAVVSLEARARVPGTYDEADPASVGSTDPQLDLRLLVGRSFELFDRPGFVDAQLAYRARFGDPAGEIRADLTLGLRPVPRLMILAQSFNVIGDGSAAGVFENARYHKLQLSAVWEVSRSWSVQVGAVATVAGAHALKERGVVAALWHRF